MAAVPPLREPAALPAQAPIGILGGTGAQGLGLARRFAAAGHPVLLGSRDPGRAAGAARPLAEAGLAVRGGANLEAAAAELVVVAVPYEGHRELLTALAGVLAGRVVVDCVNPIGFDDRGPYPLPVPAGSAAEEAAAVLPRSQVVAAFHHVSAVVLADPAAETVDCDVLVCSDHREAADAVVALAGRVPGMRGVYAGRLRLSGQLEALTTNLIAVNRRYRAHAGLRVTGV